MYKTRRHAVVLIDAGAFYFYVTALRYCLLKLVLLQLGQGGIVSPEPRVTSVPQLSHLYDPAPGVSPVLAFIAAKSFLHYIPRKKRTRISPVCAKPCIVILLKALDWRKSCEAGMKPTKILNANLF
ncbi:MAG: hypothetical protein RR998_10090 [Oscillospiraceae bacterium]